MNPGKNSSASVPARRGGRGGSRYIFDVCFATICIVVVSPALAQSDAEFAKANQEYAKGHFKWSGIIPKPRPICRSRAMKRARWKCNQACRNATCNLLVSINTASRQRSLFGWEFFALRACFSLDANRLPRSSYWFFCSSSSPSGLSLFMNSTAAAKGAVWRL